MSYRERDLMPMQVTGLQVAISSCLTVLVVGCKDLIIEPGNQWQAILHFHCYQLIVYLFLVVLNGIPKDGRVS